jgi:Na+-translocating ferredoxin:NAD+ oxidoreductase RnfD subunit
MLVGMALEHRKREALADRIALGMVVAIVPASVGVGYLLGGTALAVAAGILAVLTSIVAVAVGSRFVRAYRQSKGVR